ncbi:MAG: nucleotidyltransferase family protein, partial [Clostridia bacterium]|nr:nucleotidyltransferase family protein [Clostridia bacterium]
MKICTVIAEYNPFHNGHLKQLEYIKNNLKPDYVIVIMSGNFTERGDVAILDKYTRASHAVLGGADLVLELPQVFASQNAEVFSKGALSILSKLPGEKTLCFG